MVTAESVGDLPLIALEVSLLLAVAAVVAAAVAVESKEADLFTLWDDVDVAVNRAVGDWKVDARDLGDLRGLDTSFGNCLGETESVSLPIV